MQLLERQVSTRLNFIFWGPNLWTSLERAVLINEFICGLSMVLVTEIVFNAMYFTYNNYQKSTQ